MQQNLSPSSSSSILNLFFFRTEAEAICSCLIANNLKGNEPCFFFAFKQESRNVAEKLSKTKTFLIENKAKNFITRTREIKKQIEDIESVVGTPSKIVIHLGRLYNSTTNYYINALIKNHPDVKVVAHIIPHGLDAQNMRKLRTSLLVKIKIKNLIRKPFGLSFYDKIHDHYGFSSPITEKIYVFPGFEEQVKKFHSNVVTLPIGSGIGKDHFLLENKMLVIGQKNIAANHMTEEALASITKKIIAIARENNIKQIDYLPHPRRKKVMELFDPSFNQIQTKYSAEVVVVEGSYKIVIGFTSTGLVFSKLLLGNSSIKVMSVGVNLSRKAELIHGILKLMRQIGVDVIDV